MPKETFEAVLADKSEPISAQHVFEMREPDVLQLRELGGARGDLSGDPEAD
ncbi:hypothetical protein [Paraburkholderia susongensis]|uniref:hypothetical protein n=1 Tax=Paraburkholderia susongensis TaxID=1515439 RepID=UPI00142E74CD|nr:hypothetical protein [Paraburkholderia susongensis]